MTQQSIDPTTGTLVEEVAEHTDAEVRARLDRAARAATDWRASPLATRTTVLRAVARLFRERRDDLARLLTREMGKPIAQSEAEVEKSASACEYYAEHAGSMLAPETIASDASRSYVRFDPLGVVLALMPWNFPIWQVIRFAAPALAAGNVAVLKHASNVPLCARELECIFADAGAPEGVFTTLLIGSARVDAVIRDPVVAAVTLTGSEAAGVQVARTCGEVIKKTVLELGGSDAFLVLDDADLDAAAATAVTARTINNGQSCIASKRFIVVDAVAEAFTSRLVERMQALVVGDPMDRTTHVGPLARADLVDALEEQVTASVKAGARVACGGRRVDRAGFFYAPTVLDGVRAGMPAFDEETFGPVAAVIRARDDADAITLANASRYGLGSSIWSRDVARAEAVASTIDAGCVFVNGMVKSDPRLPFGGVKRSGYGRELGTFGIREFVNVKTVWIA